MPIGTVKSYNDVNRYGFITLDYEGKDIFVYKSEIQTADKTLKEGQKVKFEIEEEPKGLCAVKVKLC